ncbi:MAG: hypothetical protein IT161_05485 [Bryobacterales bacterium]|nr:hypothetical protein [Bryobacterales bacterium]
MAKLKPAGGKKTQKLPVNPGAVPCLILIVLFFILLGVVLYLSLKQA